MKNKLLLIDGNSIMNRAFYGVRELTNAEGLHTNAIFGFLNIMLKMIEEEAATHIVVAFDLKAPTFRHIRFEQYKGNRKPMPEELREQMPVIKELLGQMGIKICEKEGFEADDILGTLAVEASRQDIVVTILSGDRDMLQIASEEIKVSIPKTKGGVTTTEHYHAKDVVEAYGVSPKAFIDVKGLMGDTSDNIPGVPGIGEKTAIKLIQAYDSIEGIYDQIDTITGKVNTQLKENKEIALLSKELATICTTCDTGINLTDCKIGQIYNDDAYLTFKKLEFKTFFDRFKTNITQVEVTKNVIMVNEGKVLKDLLQSSDFIAYNLQYDKESCFLTFTFDGASVYYTDATTLEREFIINQVTVLLENINITKATLDLKEQLHLINLDIPTENKSIYDLALTAYLINPLKETYDMDDLSSDFLQRPMKNLEELLGKGKNKKSYKDIDRTELLDFMTNCAAVIYQSYEIIIERLESDGLIDLYFNIELPLLYVLKRMETLGVLVDAYQLKEYGDKLHVTLLELEQKIYAYAQETFNINSPKQLGVILFEKLNLPTDKKTKTSYSTAADVLEKLKYKHPIVMEILSYRQLSKLKSTYADGLFEYIGKDGRIHSNFNQKVTSTGRISSTEPNLQNIPIRMEIGREIRKSFIPKEGHVFIDADYSQIELRLLAHLSEDETFIHAFNNNLDIHTMTASQVFHTPFEEVTALQRRNAKAVNFGIVYGISAFGLSEDLGITRKEAADYIEQYFTKYSKVKEFLDYSVQEAKLNGYVKTMYGRIRNIPELNSSNFMQRQFGERVAMNTPIQGSAADIIKIAMINVYKKLKNSKLTSELILTVHDELVVETHKDEINDVKLILTTEMENAVKLRVPLTVDVHVGNNWYDAK